jgi:phage-related protein
LSRIAEAYVQIVPRIDGVAKSMGNQLSGEMGGAGQLGGKGFAAGFKKILGPALAAISIVGVARLGKALVSAGEEAATSNARITQIAESMGLFGDEAGTVSKRLQEVAQATALQTGADNNSIKATQAKLLTFKQLAATAGDVGGSFDRATKAAVDLAAAGFGSAETNAVQLGKALNDPIKGITALNRSGITFTEVEKEKIKALTESGQVLEAQALILEAIEKQVGGVAGATANMSDRLAVAGSIIKERFGAALLPVFEAIGEVILNKVLPIALKIADRLPKAFEAVSKFFSGLFSGEGGVQGFIKTLLDLRQKLFDAIMKALPGIIQAIIEFIPVLVQNTVSMITALIEAIVDALPLIIDGAIQLFNGIIEGLLLVLPVLIDAVVTAIPVIIKAIVEALPKMIDGAIKLFLGVIAGLLKALPLIIDALVKAIPLIIRAIVQALPLIIAGAIELFLGITIGLVKALPEIIAAIIDAMPLLIQAVIDAVPLFIQAGIDLIGGLIKGIGQAIPQLIGAIGSAIGSAINAGKKALGIKSPSTVFADIGKDTVEGLAIGITRNSSKPIKAIQSLSSRVNQAGGLGPQAYLSSQPRAQIGGPSSGARNLTGAGSSSKTVNYYAAPNNSIDSEQALFQAIKRARVITSW